MNENLREDILELFDQGDLGAVADMIDEGFVTPEEANTLWAESIDQEEC